MTIERPVVGTTAYREGGSVRLPVPITEIVNALEREAVNTDTDVRWLAASWLRQMTNWERRTLMCKIDTLQVIEPKRA